MFSQWGGNVDWQSLSDLGITTMVLLIILFRFETKLSELEKQVELQNIILAKINGLSKEELEQKYGKD